MNAWHVNLCTGSNSLVVGTNNTCNHDNCLVIGTGLTTTMHGQVLIGNNKNVQSGAITPEDLREFKQILLQSLGGVTWQAEQSAELERLRKCEKDAERWRKLRAMDWFDSPFCVVRDPKGRISLGSDCPSGTRLDSFIDAIEDEKK